MGGVSLEQEFDDLVEEYIAWSIKVSGNKIVKKFSDAFYLLHSFAPVSCFLKKTKFKSKHPLICRHDLNHDLKNTVILASSLKRIRDGFVDFVDDFESKAIVYDLYNDYRDYYILNK